MRVRCLPSLARLACLARMACLALGLTVNVFSTPSPLEVFICMFQVEMAPSVMAATGPPAAALPRSSGSGGTTTIGTIAVNSGFTKMVIAILRCDGGGGGDGGCGARLTIKVLELEPGLAHLGGTLEEAAELLRAHDLVIESLESKQTPVEELLRQADDLIANQRPKAEVYTAMAESLGQAWKDLNDHLEQRKDVLKLNFNFQGHFEVRRFSSQV